VAGPSNQTDIINKAAVLLGSTKRMNSINDESDTARNLKALWDIARRALLASHTWNFAVKRVKINREEDVPAFGWAYQFAKPANCLRFLPWARGEEFFFDGEEEGEFILSNDESIHIRYLADIEEAGKWPPLFVDAMAYQLAFEYCEGKTGMKGLRQSLSDDLDKKLGRPMSAKMADGLATNRRGRGNVVVQSRWASARHAPHGIIGR
jgi:hypothetical protein